MKWLKSRAADGERKSRLCPSKRRGASTGEVPQEAWIIAIGSADTELN